jgi:hypothetical protein
LGWRSDGIVGINGSYLAHERQRFLLLGHGVYNFVICIFVINTHTALSARAVVLYASAFLFIVAAWAFVLDGQVLSGVHLAVSLVLVVSTSVLAYWVKA